MVRTHFDGCIPKPKKVYPPLPVEQRLSTWFTKTTERTAFMRQQKPETHLHLTDSIASGLGLKNSAVTIRTTGTTTELLSAERESPLATLSAASAD